MDGGKLSEVNARTESRRQNELVGKFKMAASDLVSVRGRLWSTFTFPFNSCWNVRVLHNLPPNTDQITRRHLELAYQFVLSSRLSPGINLR